MLPVAVGAAAGLLYCAFRYPVWFPHADALLTLGAGVLLVAVAAVACRQARAVTSIDEPKSRDGFFWATHDGFIWLHPDDQWRSDVTPVQIISEKKDRLTGGASASRHEHPVKRGGASSRHPSGATWKPHTPARERAVGFRYSLVFWVGAALFVTLAYSLADVVPFGSPLSLVSWEFIALRYQIAIFTGVLFPVALLIPLACTGRSAGGIVAAAAFGFALATNQPDLSVGGVAIPLGAVLLSLLVYAFVKKDDQDNKRAIADTVLAVKIAALLAIIPVGYFIYTTLTNLPSILRQPGTELEFTVSSLLSQVTGWLVIGVFFGALGTRLPGRIGPLRALILSWAWFAVAIVVHIVNNGLHYSADRAWLFPGLQLLLFLIAFSVIWDAYALKQDTLAATVEKLRAAYHVQENQPVRAIALYAIPVLVALVGLIQQVATGSGTDFVTGILNGAAAAFGGRP
jgi:hypothetical protein